MKEGYYTLTKGKMFEELDDMYREMEDPIWVENTKRAKLETRMKEKLLLEKIRREVEENENYKTFKKNILLELDKPPDYSSITLEMLLNTFNFTFYPEQIDWAKNIFFTNNKVTLFLGARRYGKTEAWMLGLMWMLTQNSNLSFYIVCQTESKARKLLSSISQKMQLVGFNGDFNSNYVKLDGTTKSKEYTIKISGTNSSVRGTHIDYLIMDDPIEPKDAFSEALQNRAYKFFTEAQSIAEHVTLIGQYVNEGDLYCKIEQEQDKGVRVIKKPYGTIPELDIEFKDLSITKRDYYLNYKLEFLKGEDMILSLDEDDYIDDHKILYWDTYAHVDLSYSNEVGTDFTALTIGQVYDNNIYIHGYIYKNVTRLYMDIKDIITKHKIKYISFDDSLDKEGHFKKTVESLLIYPPHIYGLGKERENKELKIVEYILPFLRQKRIKFSKKSHQEYLNHIRFYGSLDYKHDDAPDSLACLIRELIKRYRKVKK